MQPALLIRLRPRGPWRYGPGEGGGSDTVDTLFRSDRLFSAVTLAMKDLGALEPWLDATARASAPVVAFSSLFPYQAETLFVPPPQTVWPPPPPLVTAPSPAFLTKTRWNLARFVPLSLIDSVISGQPILADQWVPDPDSGCLLRRDRPSSSPFRTVIRSAAAVDRVSSGAVHISSFACTEFEQGSGLWTVVRYADQAAESVWDARVKAAFQLLADTGFGGRRKCGWGQTDAPEFSPGAWPSLILPKAARLLNGKTSAETGATRDYWLLSLYSPSASDTIDWTAGDYLLSIRNGYTERNSAASSLKKSVRMIDEGSVITAAAEPVGAAVDVAPDGFPHPVYRSGFALAVPLPVVSPEADQGPVEEPTVEEALESRPCAPEPTEASAEASAEVQPEPQAPESPAESPAEPQPELQSAASPEEPSEAPAEPAADTHPATNPQEEEPGNEL